uniref:E3 ubiquitin-protein ligase n=1 Tax=Timema poppense TaxID=170557 RepID=A0A7R9HFM7_TIMPO|nr:unnamed protein product [Timema poppensis]
MRPVGGARRRCEDKVRRDLKDMGCNEMDWIELARDKDGVFNVNFLNRLIITVHNFFYKREKKGLPLWPDTKMVDIRQDSEVRLRLELLSILDCPVCFCCMGPPIFQCLQGHSICQKCKDRVSSCPTCRDTSVVIRNRMAERLSTSVELPCRYRQYGCPGKLSLGLLVNHENGCRFKLYKCRAGVTNKPGPVPRCGWKGVKSKLYDHVVKAHNLPALNTANQNCYVSNYDLTSCRNKTTLGIAFGELFWLHEKCCPYKRGLFKTIQHVSPPEEGKKYVYEIAVQESILSDMKMAFRNSVADDIPDAESIFASRECFYLDYDILPKFLHEGKLTFMISTNISD